MFTLTVSPESIGAGRTINKRGAGPPDLVEAAGSDFWGLAQEAPPNVFAETDAVVFAGFKLALIVSAPATGLVSGWVCTRVWLLSGTIEITMAGSVGAVLDNVTVPAPLRFITGGVVTSLPAPPVLPLSCSTSCAVPDPDPFRYRL